MNIWSAKTYPRSINLTLLEADLIFSDHIDLVARLQVFVGVEKIGCIVFVQTRVALEETLLRYLKVDRIEGYTRKHLLHLVNRLSARVLNKGGDVDAISDLELVLSEPQEET